MDVLRKSPLQAAWDFVGMPFRLALFDQKWLPRLGWTTLEEERLGAVLPHLRGRILDIGAGPNELVRRYGNGVGVDVVEWGGGALVVEDSSRLPFENGEFDTVTIVAALNHIPYREKTLREVVRVLRPEGRLVVTMIDPILGGVGHAIWWYGEHNHRGGMLEGERGGLWNREVISLARDAGFSLTRHERFVYWLNNLFVFDLPSASR